MAGALATGAMLLLAAPALTLRTGPPGITQLPAGDPARESFEEISRVMGPGWATPYNMVVVNPRGPLTTPPMLAKLDALQTGIARGRRVASVAGPGGLSSRNEASRDAPRPAERIEQAARRRAGRPAQARRRPRAGGQRRGPTAQRTAVGVGRRRAAARRRGHRAERIEPAACRACHREGRLIPAVRRPGAGARRRQGAAERRDERTRRLDRTEERPRLRPGARSPPGCPRSNSSRS